MKLIQSSGLWPLQYALVDFFEQSASMMPIVKRPSRYLGGAVGVINWN